MKIMTTAAGLLVTVTVVTLLIPVLRAPSSAFAQALQQVREARSMSYTNVITQEGRKQPATTREFIAEDGRKRSEMPGAGKSGGIVTIFEAAGFIRLTLIES